jgi:hypothetical protein
LTPVLMLTSVTVTPGKTAPVASVTVPRISPVLRFCERAGLARHISRQDTTAKRSNPFISFLPPQKLTIPSETAVSCMPVMGQLHRAAETGPLKSRNLRSGRKHHSPNQSATVSRIFPALCGADCFQGRRTPQDRPGRDLSRGLPHRSSFHPRAARNIVVLLAPQLVLLHYPVLPDLAPVRFPCQEKKQRCSKGNPRPADVHCFFAASLRYNSRASAVRIIGTSDLGAGVAGELPDEASQRQSASKREASRDVEGRGGTRQAHS